MVGTAHLPIYQVYIGAKANKIGRCVKEADIRDNLDISRIDDITERDINRLNRYKKALSILTD